jgi:hypothetical protein
LPIQGVNSTAAAAVTAIAVTAVTAAKVFN